MSRYADLDALEKELNERLTFLRERNGNYDQYTDGFDEAVDRVENFQTADVAPVVYGRWVPSESDFDDGDVLFDVEEWCDWQCSACHEDICYEDPLPLRFLPKFCPNCGARMDGGDGNAST